MFFIMLSWMWIGVSAFLWGIAATSILGGTDSYQSQNFDITIVSGLCMLTVYAQFFSLFHGVGKSANIILLLINICLIFLSRKKILNFFQQVIHIPRLVLILISIAILCSIVLLNSKGIPYQYDTGLYHAQSIHWIETYGVVPGLGNLHNRLAYNSSFFCLQALFSWSFWAGQSMHSVNGFFTLLLLGYAICSMKIFSKGKFYMSDFLRMAIIFFFNYDETVYVISSPGSDLMTLGLVTYIFTKWISHLEDQEEEIYPYAILCILGVFAVSLKLSAAMVVLLVIKPACKLIQRKNWKKTRLYLFAGLVVILPYLIRNVIISGYLIYPYPELDLFDVDWKMPAYTLLFDRNEIKAWGWGLNNVWLFDSPFSNWFPVWYGNLNTFLQILFWCNLVSVGIALIIGFYRYFKQKDGNYLLVSITIISCFLLWFIGSPSPRYGFIYLMLLPMLIIGTMVSSLRLDRTRIPSYLLIVASIILCMKPMIQSVFPIQFINRFKGSEYIQYPHNALQLDNITIYVPESGDQSGYHYFPSTPYATRLNFIELRGADLSDGFRMKPEYRNAYISTYGEIAEQNLFEAE